MCGRVFVKSTIPDMVRRFEFAHPGDVELLSNRFPVWNGRPAELATHDCDKGSSKPLIDSGAMRQAVTYKVED
jgi:hypothetical protein